MKWSDINDWVLLWSRGMSIQKSMDYIPGAMINLENVFGKGLGYMLMVQNNSNIEFFLSEKDYNQYLDYYEKKISIEFLDKMELEIISVQFNKECNLYEEEKLIERGYYTIIQLKSEIVEKGEKLKYIQIDEQDQILE
jgi:hypothetical protein